MNRAVISAAAVASPMGMEREVFSRRMFNGESGIGKIDRVTTEPIFPVHGVGLLPEGFFPPINDNCYALETEVLLNHLLKSYFASESRHEPFDGIVYGTNNGAPRFADIQFFQASQQLSPHTLRQDHGLNFIRQGLTAVDGATLDPRHTLVCSNVCITGLQAIGYALQRVRMGLNKRVLVICDEVRIRKEELLRLNALGALTQKQLLPEQLSQPFSQTRSGFVKGEGAGLLVVEEENRCRLRGGTPLARVLGHGQSSDAWRLTDGREDAKGAEAAIRMALHAAKITPQEIDYINAHGTSTLKNDWLETATIKRVFGDRAFEVPISSLKSQIGHLNFACGIVETIACLSMLEVQTAAPTINLSQPDPECDLNYVPNRAISTKIDYVLKNSFGFGGTNAALVLGKI